MTAAHPLAPLRARPQRGMSLIELLVAITIGLFIVLGLATVFINMKTAFATQDQLGQLEDTERLVLTMLSNAVRQGGYVPSPQSTSGKATLVLPASAPYAAAQGVYGTSATGVSDTIVSRYASGGTATSTPVAPAGTPPIADCLGNTAYNPGDQLINTYQVNSSNELTCTVTVNGVAGTAVALVGNGASISVLYATDPGAVCPCTATRYLTAAQVTSAGVWMGVVSARITVNFTNPYSATAAVISRTQTVNLMNK